MKINLTLWLRYLIIIVIGFALYFLSKPYLPPPAIHHGFMPDLGTVVMLWYCLVVFGLFELIRYLRKRRKS